MLSKDDKIFLLNRARESISEDLGGIPIKKSDKRLGSGGIFVTLMVGKNLRGCIGLVSSEEDLTRSVVSAAKAAAFGDPRFPRLSKEELKKIKIEISILSNPKEIERNQFIVGKHGLILSYRHNSGLLLPQVASEHNLSEEEFLDALCEKAGLPSGTWKKKGAQLLAFEAEVFDESSLNVKR